ncbi:MAG: AsmA family protein [candidate division Zixibacteria bacterium]|nr:AsmA family protein [candidate division Zixibacteria bacterium]
MVDKKKKSQGMGCLTRLFIVGILLIIVVYVGATLFFPAERLKGELIKQAEDMLQRQVELDDISFSIFPTPHLELTGIRIYNPEDFAGGEFVSVDKLQCGVELLPLISGEYKFTEIIIEHPVLKLRKAPDGRVNYSFEIHTGGKPIQTPLGPKEKVTSEEVAMTAFAVDWAEINHGDIIYTDDSSEYKFTLNNFSMKSRLHLNPDGKSGRSNGTIHIPSMTSELLPNKLPVDIKLAYNAGIDFQNSDITFEKTRLEINGIAFDVESTIRNFKDPSSIFAKISASDVSIEPLLKYIPSSENFNPDDLRLQGEITGNVESRIELKSKRQPYLVGSFTFSDLTAGYQNIAGRLSFESLKVDFNSDSVSFVSSGGTLSGKPFAIAGNVSNWDDLTYSLKTKGLYDISGLTPFLDKSLNNELKGNADFDLSISGIKSNWVNTKVLGRLTLDKMFFNNDSLTSPLERLDIDLLFKKNSVEVEQLYAEYPGVNLSLSGTVTNGFAHLLEPKGGHRKPSLDFKLSSSLINYDILLPEDAAVENPSSTVSSSAPSSSSSPSISSSGTIAANDASLPIFIPDIEAQGTIAVDKFIFREMEFTGITGRLEYNDGIISYHNIKCMIYGGDIQADGSVDINDMYQPFVKSEFQAENIEANEVMTQLANLGGHLFGKVNAKGRLAGRGSEPEDFIKSMSAESNVKIDEGRIVNIDLIEKLADKFSFKTFEEEQIKNLVSDILIRDGKLLLDGTKVFNRMGDWDIVGTIAFIDKKLDLQVGLYLSEQYSQNMNFLGDLLKDDRGRVKVNFKIIGTYEKPDIANISTENDAVKSKVEEKLKKEANKFINNLFKKK